MEFLTLLVLLACPVSMGAMMWWMARSSKKKQQPVESPGDLIARRDRLDKQIADYERLGPLVAERDR